MDLLRRKLFLPCLLLLWFFGMLMVGAKSLSFTLDEPIHIAAGYALWARGRDALWVLPLHGHPPLLNLMEAALVYLEKPDIPLERLDGWGYGLSEFMRAFYPHLRPVARMEFVARAPIIGLTILLGALVYRWAGEMWGRRAGLIALIALVFDPLLLAHGRLATTDAGTVAMGTASLYIAWRWMKAPSWGKALILGGLLGLTTLAKGSGVFWAGAVALQVLWKVIEEPQKRDVRLMQGIVLGFISLLILWAGYGFTWGSVDDLPGLYPAPAYWIGLLSQAHSAEERWVFALGLRKHGHWWWYFPLAFVLKNPLPLLTVVVIEITAFLRRPRLNDNVVALSLFPALYSFVAITRGMNIGYRHMLPIHPTIYFLTGYAVSGWLYHSSPRLRQAVVAALGLWYIFGTLFIFPYEIAYFNELTGGPKNAHRYLVDANLDWGQGYKALRRYLDEHPGPKPKFAPRFTYIQPEDYGIVADLLPPAYNAVPLEAPFHPQPGRYVISITTLQQGWPADNGIYAWFRQLEPTAVIGYSFFVYDINLPLPEWFAQCNIPAPPLSAPLITWGFGQENLRVVDFDCTSAWIYPTGGARPGAYGFHYGLMLVKKWPFTLRPSPLRAADPFIARHLADLRLSLNMDRYTTQYPAFVLYEQEHFPPLPSPQTVIALPATDRPSAMLPSQTTPLAMDGPLTFLGAKVYPDDSALDIETWWQVTEGPITRPLSIMGHLLTAEGEVIGQDDGLGVSPVIWQPGDIIVQRHRFSLPPAGTELWLRTGVYWLDTMARWTVSGTPGADAIFVPLNPE